MFDILLPHIIGIKQSQAQSNALGRISASAVTFLPRLIWHCLELRVAMRIPSTLTTNIVTLPPIQDVLLETQVQAVWKSLHNLTETTRYG